MAVDLLKPDILWFILVELVLTEEYSNFRIKFKIVALVLSLESTYVYDLIGKERIKLKLKLDASFVKIPLLNKKIFTP